MIPKFRVAFKNNILGEVGSIDFVDETVTIPVYDKADGEYLGDNVLGLNQVTLMQSTGLFDKNGKEIFESDILKCTSFDGSLWYETVSWDSTLAGFATQQDGYDATAISYITDSKVITIEIIGNLHQNPELVEAEND